NNNAWLSKGTNTQPNYALWSTATDAMQMPIYDIFGFLSSPLSPAGTTGVPYNVLEYSNTVIFGLFPSRNVYKNAVNTYNDVNLLQLPVNNANQLYLGNVQGAAGWFLNGNMAEVIMYNGPVNSTQRIIISNYLSAKYGLTLATTDIYQQDQLANGNYDHEVAGIGRVSNTSMHTDSRGSAVVRINNPSNLGNNEFLIWGHDNGVLGAWGSTDLPAGVQGRWFRVWRVNEVSQTGVAVDVGNVDITFDLTNQGPVTASDLRLLVDINNNGIFADDAPIAGAVAAGGNLYRFPAINALVNPRRFTLGTINTGNTPLPVELVSFAAKVENNNSVRLEWSTASEHNNDHFTVERGRDGFDWNDLLRVPSVGNSSSLSNYSAYDTEPLSQLSYYRLRQTDLDGSSTHSNAVAVRIDRPASELLIYPDPAQDEVNVVFDPQLGSATVSLFNSLGQAFAAPVTTTDGRARIDVSALPPGGYLVMVITEREVLQKRLLVTR
ncbi:MAG: T9SS type A sorting domain-containing protein, partial [Flavobacteriales bacterium]